MCSKLLLLLCLLIHYLMIVFRYKKKLKKDLVFISGGWGDFPCHSTTLATCSVVYILPLDRPLTTVHETLVSVV